MQHRTVQAEAHVNRLLTRTGGGQLAPLFHTGAKGIVACVCLLPFAALGSWHRRFRTKLCACVLTIRLLQTWRHVIEPPCEWLVHIHVALNSIDDSRCPERMQPFVHLNAEAAEVFVILVPETEHRISKTAQHRRVIRKQLVAESSHVLRRLTFSVRARHKKCELLLGNHCGTCFIQRDDFNGMATDLELLDDLLCQTLCCSALRSDVHRELQPNLVGRCSYPWSRREECCEKPVEPLTLLRRKRSGSGNIRNVLLHLKHLPSILRTSREAPLCCVFV